MNPLTSPQPDGPIRIQKTSVPFCIKSPHKLNQILLSNSPNKFRVFVGVKWEMGKGVDWDEWIMRQWAKREKGSQVLKCPRHEVGLMAPSIIPKGKPTKGARHQKNNKSMENNSLVMVSGWYLVPRHIMLSWLHLNGGATSSWNTWKRRKKGSFLSYIPLKAEWWYLETMTKTHQKSQNNKSQVTNLLPSHIILIKIQYNHICHGVHFIMEETSIHYGIRC